MSNKPNWRKMALSKRASIFLSVVTEKTFLKSFLSWPVFSFTSFHMLTSLSKQGFSINTVIDVGANVGQFAVAAAKIFDQATYIPLNRTLTVIKNSPKLAQECKT